MDTAVGVGGTAVGVSVGDSGRGVVVAVDAGEANVVGDGVEVKGGKLVGVIVGLGNRGGSPSGGSPPSRD